MAAARYRAAVIGRTGRGDYGHSLDLAALAEPKLEVVAVADEDAAGRARAVERLGGVQGYADYREMLRRETPEFVVVGPRWLDGHEAMVLACAEHRVRGVFCEKPLAPDLAACDAIVDACDRTHMKLAMAFQTHYSPRWAKVKELVAAGTIGEVLELRVRGKEDGRGGGEDLMVLGVHMFDLCRDLLGEPAWCFARVTDRGRPAGPVEIRRGAEGIGPLAGERVDAMFGFSGSEAVAHFASARPPEPGRRYGLTICGSKGCFWVGMGWMAPAYLLDDPTWVGGGGAKWSPVAVDGFADRADLAAGNGAIVADLIRTVETETAPRADARAGRAAVEMVLACYASQARGGVVTLPLAERKAHPLSAPPRP